MSEIINLKTLLLFQLKVKDLLWSFSSIEINQYEDIFLLEQRLYND